MARKTLVFVLNSHFANHAHTLIMEHTQRNAHDAAFKLKAIALAVEEGNRAAARKLGINESMVRHFTATLQALFGKKHLFNENLKNLSVYHQFCVNISCYNVDTCSL